MFAGLIDVQDRSFQNRSYTTGHKSFRARATVELGDAIGWDLAHDVLYAGALDIAVGPRWYSLYEAASNAVMVYLEARPCTPCPMAARPSWSAAILANNKAPLTKPESDALLDVILHQPEPGYLEQVTALLKAGKDPRSILDAIQVGCAEIVARHAQRPQLLPAAALLRVLQHARLVLGHVRPSAADQAALSRGRLPQPGRPSSKADWRPPARTPR